MARHTSPGDDSFRRSLGRAVAGGLVAMAVTALVTGVLTQLGRDDGSGGPAVVFDPGVSGEAPTASAAPTPERSARPRPRAAPSKRPRPARRPEPEEKLTIPELEDGEDDKKRGDDVARRDDDVPPPAQTSVQVLDGVGTGEQAADAAETLRDLGYDVVVVNPAGTDVAATTVLATDGHEAEAEALRDRDERFGEVAPNTAFSDSVDLHVLVGADWPG